MTQNDNGPGLGRNYGEMAVFTFGQKVFFWPKMHFIPKKTPKICFEADIHFGNEYFFLCELFFWARNHGFWPKNTIFVLGPQFWSTRPFVAFRETVHLPRSERFFDFSFPSYGRVVMDSVPY